MAASLASVWPALLLLLVLLPCAVPGQPVDSHAEALLHPFQGYESVAILQYTVPHEVTRATWSFASFQQSPSCPRRLVHLYIQHGAFPVFSGDNASFPENYHLNRTQLHSLTLHSDTGPKRPVVHQVYNPLPGSWFVAAYLAPYTEPVSLGGRCLYSIGSTGQWRRVSEGVPLLEPNIDANFTTSRHFSYYKFLVPESADGFRLALSKCKSLLRKPHRRSSEGKSEDRDNSRHYLEEKPCIDFADIRASALPFNDDKSPTARKWLSETDEWVFHEERPVKGATYYLLVVSQARTSFEAHLTLWSCGIPGIYGPGQRDWYLSQKGLMYSEKYNASTPKEPVRGFQLFSIPTNSELLNSIEATENASFHESQAKFRPLNPSNKSLATTEDTEEIPAPVSAESLRGMILCPATFDMMKNKMQGDFVSYYFLYGHRWFTNYLEVPHALSTLLRFETVDFLDLGAFLNIDLRLLDYAKDHGTTQVVLVCLSRLRRPLSPSRCEEGTRISLSNENTNATKASLVIPFPEPGTWYLAFQLTCGDDGQCPDGHNKATLHLQVYTQPCGRQSPGSGEQCGSNGACALVSRGMYRFSACRCSQGYSGWACHDARHADGPALHLLKTLLLTLSNVAFIPSVLLALYYALYTPAFIYAATMFFSAFYHTCDEHAESLSLPTGLQHSCKMLYLDREVLQFTDFFCATLSFWVTIVALAKLPEKLVNFLHMFGVILVALLVQYNRNGAMVFLIPIPLGLLVLAISIAHKSWVRRKIFTPNKSCLLLFCPALMCVLVALGLFLFAETADNYPYIHSLWHVFIALSLVFLLPRCKEAGADWDLRGQRKQTDLEHQSSCSVALDGFFGPAPANPSPEDDEEPSLTSLTQSTSADELTTAASQMGDEDEDEASGITTNLTRKTPEENDCHEEEAKEDI